MKDIIASKESIGFVKCSDGWLGVSGYDFCLELEGKWLRNKLWKKGYIKVFIFKLEYYINSSVEEWNFKDGKVDS